MSTLISNAVPSNAVAAVLGYKLETADFSKSTPNLPMRIAILVEANTSKSLADFSKFSFTSLKAVADKFGAGGVAYLVARVLRPMSGGGLAGIPIDIFPVEPNAGQTATVKTLTITGTATAAVKHTALIAGHDNIDGQYFSVNIAAGDNPTVIAGKYVTAINNVVGSPVTATNSAGSTTATSSAVGPIVSLPTKVDFDGSTGYVTGTPSNVFTGAFALNVNIEADSYAGYVFSNSTHILIAFIGTGSDIAFGNGTGWAEFTKASGVWRFVHDTSQTGFARYRAFKDGVEQSQARTSGTYAAPNPPSGFPMEFGRRSIAANNYFNGRLSQIKTWSRACLPSDSDQTTGLSLNLDTISSTTWDDTSSNNTDYTLTGGATAV